ncbi:uncharacterized protein H6S33_001340 [Morchella sextelata]|uniref:uncharacterized protein n=1 Tax=Morchella sextelata TaxID=1174677 RepID=UPI001D03F2EF|nr:uncharacterized protein H6S33_001340 [Morchella sextelata]KAH0609112.1 hypothetical protein H6S33_001340 [Morchella sextelata]
MAVGECCRYLGIGLVCIPQNHHHTQYFLADMKLGREEHEDRTRGQNTRTEHEDRTRGQNTKTKHEDRTNNETPLDMKILHPTPLLGWTREFDLPPGPLCSTSNH